jgi:hypothetical protein
MALTTYRKTTITRDTYDAMRRVEQSAKEYGHIQVEYNGVSRDLASWDGVKEDAGPLDLPPHLSMRPSGREVYLSLAGLDDPMQRLAALWSIAVPLGFVPWDRYPVPSETSHVFHYLGPWSTVGDFLHGEGRGDLAWPSMCCAAQIETGSWEGTHTTERTIQTHLHRLGIHCGPVDGNMGPVTLSAMKALGLTGLESVKAAEALVNMSAPPIPKRERQQGHLILGGVPMQAFSSGGVHTVETRNGYALSVDGPGRLIVMVGER